MKRIQFVVCLLAILACLFGMPVIPTVQASNSTLQVQILDASTALPITNATVAVFNTTLPHYSRWALISIGQTDIEGYYSTPLEEVFRYRAYVFYDELSSPGFDYLPAYHDFFLKGSENAVFSLLPAASITIMDQLRFAESEFPVYPSFFTIIDPTTLSVPSNDKSIFLWGESSPHTNALRSIFPFHPTQLILPAETHVHIMVNTSIEVNNEQEHKSFIIGNEGQFDVGRGQNVSVSLNPYLPRYNLETTQSKAEVATHLLLDLEDKGFYVYAERLDLTRVQNLLGKVERELTIGIYDECQADLREAYLGIATTAFRLEEMIADAVFSVTLLMIFLALTAVALSLVLFDQWIIKGLAACVFATILLAVLFFIYPGSRLVPASEFLANASVSFVMALVVSIAMRYIFGGRVVSLLSLAKRNMRRRKLRFALTCISIIALTTSFVTLTSFSSDYGLTVTPQYYSLSHPDGLMIKSQPIEVPSKFPYPKFPPLDLLIIEWIREQPEVSTFAPKVESSPAFWIHRATVSPTTNTSRTIPFTSVIGILASLEAEMTHVDDVVVEGRFLSDGEDAVLLHRDTADEMGISIGDEVIVNDGDSRWKLCLVGLFDDRLEEVVDIDAKTVMPQRMFFTEDESSIGEGFKATMESCKPSETLLVDWRTALELRDTSLLRINIPLKDTESASSLARRVALEQGLWVLSSINGRVSITVVEEYLKVKGLSVIIPWTIVMLSVVISVINAIFERRDEVAILSSLGFNPTHIEALFVAEAAIIGTVGGGFGYLLGLGAYRVMALLSIAVEVHQKVSALWSLAAMLFAVAAVVVGAVLALRYSVITTPSLLRRWTTEKPGELPYGLEFSIPVSLTMEEADSLFPYLKGIIQDYAAERYNASPSLIAMLTTESEKKTAEYSVKSIDFNYLLGKGSVPFKIIAENKGGEHCSLKANFRIGHVNETARALTLIRRVIFQWCLRI